MFRALDSYDGSQMDGNTPVENKHKSGGKDERVELPHESWVTKRAWRNNVTKAPITKKLSSASYFRKSRLALQIRGYKRGYIVI